MIKKIKVIQEGQGKGHLWLVSSWTSCSKVKTKVNICQYYNLATKFVCKIWGISVALIGESISPSRFLDLHSSQCKAGVVVAPLELYTDQTNFSMGCTSLGSSDGSLLIPTDKASTIHTVEKANPPTEAIIQPPCKQIPVNCFQIYHQLIEASQPLRLQVKRESGEGLSIPGTRCTLNTSKLEYWHLDTSGRDALWVPPS